MFTPDDTGRSASPHLDLPKSVCGFCAVCKTHLNSSSDPKLLPCLHTVCHACLTKTCTHQCPLCEQSFSLSEVTECVIFEDSSHNDEPPKCSGCEENEVVGWCVQCEEALCVDCVSAHRRVKVTRDHEVKPKNPPKGWMQRRRCPSHRQESLKFFCLVCDELTCRDCQLITHRGHSFMQEEEAVISQRQQLQSLLESIRKRNETVSTSLKSLEARLCDIEGVKVEARKRITQVVHSIYQTLLLRAKEVLNEVETLYAEEVQSLMLRKTSLNRIEDCQDYITAFIDKILSTKGHCLLVYKKRIETQVKKLLSQKTCPPETMIELHLQIQKDLQGIMKCGFMRVKKVPVPFTCSTIGFNPSVSGKASNRLNSNSAITAIDAPASSSSLQGSTNAQSNSPSSNSVPHVPQSLQAHSQPRTLKTPIAHQINNTSQSANPGKTWTFHYYPALQVSIQTPMLTHPAPTMPTNTQTSILANPISTNNQTPVLFHPVLANNQIRAFSLPVLANNQIPALPHPIPAITTDTQSPILTQQIPANNQTALTLPIPVNNQTPVLTHLIPVNNQTPVLTYPIPAIDQSLGLAQSIPANNQTPKLTPPVSNIPTNTQTLIFNHPMQANILGHVQTFATQPNNSLTVASTINTLSVNEATVAFSDRLTGATVAGNDSRTNNLSKLNPTSSAFNTIPSTTSDSSLPVNPMQSAPIGGSDTFQSQKVTHHISDPKANHPVKALADSACDQEPGVSSTNFTDMDHPESNFPTSTVPETDPGEPSTAPEKDPVHSAVPSNTHQAPLATTKSTEECSLVKSSHFLLRSPPKCGQTQTDQSSIESCSKPKRWSDRMPTTFSQLVEGTYKPFSLIDNLNAESPVDSTCSTSEGIILLARENTTHDKTVQSDFYQMMSKKEDVESAVTLEHTKQFKRFPRVTLVRLPICLPPSGQPLPQFRLTTDTSSDYILVQETQGGQIKQLWKWQEDPIQHRASPQSVAQSSDSPLVSEVEFCAVCQSAGATHLCVKCGRAFHSDCHIPPIFIKPCEEWVCLLCQDVNDETVVYGSKQMTSSLSPQDQKCEKLLLSLLCDENRCLLYSATKHRSKTAEFEIILGRFLGKRKPPYRTAAELVSDIWTVFDILATNPERRDLVFELQTSFQQQLNESFGKSLHASLLRYCSDSSDKESRNTSETQTEGEKHKKTLKRMREFFSANCGTATKRPCFDRGDERDGCGSSKANEH
ncbi:transcription intermediary factor 1-alpha-like isoform X2 [Myxocyprinus asiaticus]|uniref:transcription intermediary factor 1-alpha-like isoform X2 n=1 Tax=Myxocyprinus asiaticus TaxID=70543 RepID=UPI002221EEC4|nr:transcription intermediary factor 1-alpha-like isoform X2 [Myxocyprinus asiaticus]